MDEIDAWMVQGLCYGASSVDFFPSTGVGVDAARRVCMQCPVREQCLDYALNNQIDHGVWGGASERERHRILRRRKQVAMQA